MNGNFERQIAPDGVWSLLISHLALQTTLPGHNAISANRKTNPVKEKEKTNITINLPASHHYKYFYFSL